VAKHSLVYGLGMVISRSVSFIMLPIYTRYLTPADYGVMALVEMTLDVIAILGGALRAPDGPSVPVFPGLSALLAAGLLRLGSWQEACARRSVPSGGSTAWNSTGSR
jgi:hypothetical protein